VITRVDGAASNERRKGLGDKQVTARRE